MHRSAPPPRGKSAPPPAAAAGRLVSPLLRCAAVQLPPYLRTLPLYYLLPVLLCAALLLLWSASRPPSSAVGALDAGADARGGSSEAFARRVEDAHCRADTERLSSGSASACLVSLPAPPPRAAASDADAGAPPLHLFLRVAAVQASFSGGSRYLGWRKSHLSLATAASLRAGLDWLADESRVAAEGGAPPLAPPRAVNITVIYDGLQRDARRLAAWQAAMSAVLTGDWRGRFPLGVRHVAASVGAELAPLGNRGTNLVQFRLFRELPCAVAAATTAAAPAARDEPRVYFVEDDYLHAPSALGELLEVLSLRWMDGSGPARFATPFDHPDRLTRGGRDAGFGATAVYGGARRAWRSVPSTTMTFAARCADVARVLPALEALAPYDATLWPRLQWRTLAGVVIGAAPENELVGPAHSLAIHATTKDVSLYGPPAGAGYASWCGLAACLRDAALEALRRRAPDALAVIEAFDEAAAQ